MTLLVQLECPRDGLDLVEVAVTTISDAGMCPSQS